MHLHVNGHTFSWLRTPPLTCSVCYAHARTQSERKAPPLPLIDVERRRPLVPHLPDYESYRDERLETLMTQGASERSLRMRATMRPDQSFNNDKRFLDLLLRKSS